MGVGAHQVVELGPYEIRDADGFLGEFVLFEVKLVDVGINVTPLESAVLGDGCAAGQGPWRILAGQLWVPVLTRVPCKLLDA